MNQQRKLSRHNSRQSSIGETTSVGSTRSGKSNGSNDYTFSNVQNPSASNNTNGSKKPNGQLGKTNQLSSQESDSISPPSTTSILNVAEMILHGVADNEILDIWLRSISCEEFVSKFIDAGYDMPTISRITPQDLTAIGITEPSKRSKILSEIKKLNLQDGLPNFRPASLSHWLSLIRLDNIYYKSLCDQKVDTIDKMCQLTWEDFEELGIVKLGHQKRIQLAIERLKGLEDESKSPAAKPISEPIYDTNPSQILLVASAENHSMNGPIINKQSSTGELSSTGSGSIHSVYSANSSHHQQIYGTMSDAQHSSLMNGNQNGLHHQQQQLPQPIYGTSSMIYQQPSQLQQNLQFPQQSHSKQQGSPQFNTINGNVSQHHRQSVGQLPFALANLPKHQQQLLQQSSIYATLSRQPGRVKPPPPPVPIRTNSLKTNSLLDEPAINELPRSTNANQTLNNFHATSTSSLFKTSGVPMTNRSQCNSQTLLTKNKSFSGNAHMEASRARFLNRNSQQPQLQQYQFSHYLPQQIQALTNQNGNVNNPNNIYGSNNTNGYGATMLNGHLISDIGQFKQPSSLSFHREQQHSGSDISKLKQGNNEDFDLNADTNSTKSLIIQPTSSSLTSSSENGLQMGNGTRIDSGSSQTLYNSASSGSNEHSLNDLYNNASQPAGQGQRQSINSTTASSCTLNDPNLNLDNQFRANNQHPPAPVGYLNNKLGNGSRQNNSTDCNATIGKDDDFPPPPSPSSLTDSDEHEITSLESDSNFNDVQHGLMTFKVGI